MARRRRPDAHLGMDRPISRRDFLNGVALGVGGVLVAGRHPRSSFEGAKDEGRPSTPPRLTGLRGDHPGSFEVAHSVRDGDFWASAGAPADTGESYDLVVVGGGISGLAAAYFYRKRAP